MHITTFNSQGWGNVVNFLSDTLAQVVLLQEVWTLDTRVDERKATLNKMGWNSVWAPSVRTDKNGISSGVAIVARN